VGIPLGDISRRPAHRPVITVSIIAINVFVFVLELLGGDAFVLQWSVVPATIVAGQRWVTILTAMFMHGSWMHIIGNMLFLWAFGPEIEDAMGPLRFLAFYLLGGVVAFASVMGGFIITYPRDQIRTLLLIGWFVDVTVIPAAVLIGIWFLIQLFSQVGSVVAAQSGGGVAYMAHVGGFIFGAITARFFEDPRRIAAQTRNWAS